MIIDVKKALAARSGPVTAPIGGGARGPRTTPQMPGAIQRAENFARAIGEHLAAGRPLATDEQVAARWAICQSNRCGFFVGAAAADRGGCAHPSCGCNLRNVGAEAAWGPNKLRWAEQACPVGLWASVQPAPSSLPASPQHEPREGEAG